MLTLPTSRPRRRDCAAGAHRVVQDDPDLCKIATALRELTNVAESTDIMLAEEMRKEGSSLTDVRKSFGISSQAAHERFA